MVGSLVDLWRDHGPAFGENGTFSGYLYSAEAERVIKAHAATHPPLPPQGSTPLFMYLAWHLVHSPLEVPALYFDPRCSDSKNRQGGDTKVMRSMSRHATYVIESLRQLRPRCNVWFVGGLGVNVADDER